jgi:PAS domain S-box-containing protein
MNGMSTSFNFDELRRRAEDLLASRGEAASQFSKADILSLIHELEVHQVELMLQNEELRNARDELEESRNAYADIYNRAPVGYVTLDREGVIVKANFSASAMLGIAAGSLPGIGLSGFVHPRDRPAYLSQIQAAAGATAERRSAEVRLLRNKIRPFHAQLEIAGSRDGTERFNGWRIILVDISDRKLAEEKLERCRKRLERSNRELQDFAFIASHDLQEPLRKVEAFGKLLKEEVTPALSAKGADYLQRMCKAAARLQDMIRGLLEYSRVHARGGEFAPLELRKIVEAAISDFEWPIEKSHAMVAVEDLPTIPADPNQMHQLFQNLISNALKFHGEEPCLIRIYAEQDEAPESEGDVWRIFFQDNGIGFDQGYAERIFSLFERLHGRSAYEGSGMGLAICWRIAERHGGTITAEGTPGKGATFIITLPAERKHPVST